jgi:hypothetical protein
VGTADAIAFGLDRTLPVDNSRVRVLVDHRPARDIRVGAIGGL